MQKKIISYQPRGQLFPQSPDLVPFIPFGMEIGYHEFQIDYSHYFERLQKN